MEKQMRRRDRALDDAQTEAVLLGAEYGIMAAVCADGTPHAVPLSFVWLDGCVYFHCALKGLKLDCIAHEPRVCFTAAMDVQAIYDKDFSTLYKSCVLYGEAILVEDREEKTRALEALCQKYLPARMDAFPAALKSLPGTAVVKILPNKITGKGKLPAQSHTQE